MSEPIKTPRTYAAAAVSFDRLMQESEQMETELTTERDSLRAEVDALRVQMKPEEGESQPERPGEPSDFAGALRRMRAAEAEVERLREDWKLLEDSAATALVDIDRHGATQVTIDNGITWHATFKDAIDDERKEQHEA